MPIVDPKIYGKHPRSGGTDGYEVVTPTKWKYCEADGTDVRVNRVRVFFS